MTDWESRYQVGDMPWEKGRAAPPLLELLEKTDSGMWGDGPILVPGCGYGHDVRALGTLGVPVVGVDLSETAVRKAREFPQVTGEIYAVADFLDPAWSDGGRYSAIWEHTCFCAIDPGDRGRYAESVAACLPVGGLLAGVFFLNPFDAGEDATGPPFGTTVAELDERFSSHFERIGGWVPEKAYPGREGREWIGLYRKIQEA